MIGKTVSLRTTLIAVVVLMAVIASGLLTWVAVHTELEARAVRWNSLATRLGDLVLRAGVELARERGRTVGLLVRPRRAAPAVREELAVLRHRVDGLHREIGELTDRIAEEVPTQRAAENIVMLRRLYADLVQARQSIDDALSGKGRPVAVTAWIATITRYIDALARARRDSFMLPGADGAPAGQQMFFLEHAHRASEYAGRERAIVAAAIAEGRPLRSGELGELQDYRAYVEESLAILIDLTGHHAGEALRRAADRAQEAFFGRFERVRAAVYGASRARAPYPLSGEAWYDAATRAIDEIVALSRALNQDSLARQARAERTVDYTRKLIIAAGMLLAGLVALTAVVVRRRILQPLDALAAASRGIARGELAEPIRPLRQDEIGALALAFEDMRLVLQRDMQKIRAAEAAVRDQELRLRTIIDMAGEAVISVDRHQKIILFNKSAEAIFGYRQEEALGQPLDILIPEEARGRHQGQVQGFAATAAGARNMKERGLIQGRRRDGSVFPVEASISKLRMGDEQIFTVILRDIGERRRAEEARARLTAIVESSTDFIGTADCDGNVLYLNKAGRRFRGLGESDSVTGLRLADFHPAWALSQTIHEGIPYAIRDGFWHGESELCNPAGQTIPVSQLILAHKDAGGQLSYLSSVMRDISERKATEQELRTRQREIEAAYENLEAAQSQLLQSEKMASIGQLAAGVAHEINNPVGYIASNLGTLAKYVDGLLEMVNLYEVCEDMLDKESPVFQLIVMAKQKTDLGYVREDVVSLVKESREGVTRVKNIVQDLKEFSHVDRAEWQQADLHQGIDSTLNIVHNEIKYKAEVVKDYGTLPAVECIAAQLNQVFMNLLVNAAQAIDTRGTITIKTGTDNDGVFVEIADTGHGMPEEVRKRIFEPFFTTKSVGKGTGLGLSLSYGIVQKHHGRIDVTSTPGQGTRFRVWVPIRRQGDDHYIKDMRAVGT